MSEILYKFITLCDIEQIRWTTSIRIILYAKCCITLHYILFNISRI